MNTEYADTDIGFIHETEPSPLDSQEVRYHIDAQRLRFRAAVSEFDAHSALCRAADSEMQLKAAMDRAGMAVHPDDIVRPADLAPHRTPTGLRDHEAGWAVCGWPMAVLALIVVITLCTGYLA